MGVIVELPRLSDTMEEGVIAKWHVSEGDKVRRGQVIADIETDKATMEFESFDAGTVLKLVAAEGETLPLGAPIAVLGKPDEDVSAILGGKAQPSAKSKGNGHAEPAKATESAAPKPSRAAPQDPVGAERREPERGAAPQRKEAAPERHEDEVADGRRIAASPLARRLAREHGVRLENVQGSGPRGRIVKADIDAAATSTKADGRAPTMPAGIPFGQPDTEVKLSQMRKTIAKRMAQANAEIPHFYLSITIDMTKAVALREQLKQAFPDAKISYNDMVVLATAKALVQHPAVNAYWNGETIVRRGDVHVGVAVAVEDGLVVPVVRYTAMKSLRQIATEARDLGTRARERKLDPSEMSGSSFTVSNLGMFGIDDFAAVVNPGEGAILAVGAITDQVVPDGDGFRVAKRMRATLACDHRVMDGAIGAQFLATLRALLEQPLGMLT